MKIKKSLPQRFDGKDCFVCLLQLRLHYVKSVCIRGYSGPHFPAFGLNMKG